MKMIVNNKYCLDPTKVSLVVHRDYLKLLVPNNILLFFFYLISWTTIGNNVSSTSLPNVDSLIGIKDLFSKYPAELKLNKYAAVEKLRERISDDDKVVRKSLYDLFKLVILPSCKEVVSFCLLKLLCLHVKKMPQKENILATPSP